MNPIIASAKAFLNEDISSSVRANLTTAVELFENGESLDIVAIFIDAALSFHGV